MRKLSLLFIVAILSMSIYRTQGQQVIVSDDASYTSPASGSMLDVKSTSKGFMPPRVTLTGRTDATTIASPTTGLMVYNTATAGTSPDNVTPGYYYNSGTTGSPSWTKVMNADVTNGMSFQDDGSPILNGTATAWDDFVVNPSLAKNSGQTLPQWALFVAPDIYTWQFQDGYDQSLDFTIQLPHSYKNGSTIYPHIHWAPTSPAALLTRVVWKIDYQWINLNGTFSQLTSSNTSAYLVVGDGSSPSVSLGAYQSTITPLPGIVGTNMTISSILVCRITRLGSTGNTNDTYTGNASMLSLDIHYEKDSFGSRTEYTK